MARNTYRNYTPEEIILIFQEIHRLHSLIDPDIDASAEIGKEMSIYDWRDASDLLPWRELYKKENEMFYIDIPYADWERAVKPERKKTLWDLCIFVSQHAKKEIIRPISICGKNCLGAAVFLTLKRNLAKRGIDVTDLRPSTSLSSYLDYGNTTYMVIEIAKMGRDIFDTFKPVLRNNLPFWQKINIFKPGRYTIDTGSIKTFKDLSRKIAVQLSP